LGCGSSPSRREGLNEQMFQAYDFSCKLRGIRVQRRRPRELSSQPASTAVVMDVLRMTSTAAVLMRRPSCVSVTVAATLQDVERLSQPLSRCVVVSELVDGSHPGTWVDNSPAQVSRMEFDEQTPVLVTTNGTRTLFAAAACADRVLLASFLDLHAVARHLGESSARSVVVVPAGNFASGDACIEDDLCADALESILAGREPDLSACEAAIRAHPRIRRRLEAEHGLAADLDLALQSDAGAAVLEFHPHDARVGHIARA
jgi:phosphosulfolactate phosphohydrolase-like enzyme